MMNAFQDEFVGLVHDVLCVALIYVTIHFHLVMHDTVFCVLQNLNVSPVVTHWSNREYNFNFIKKGIE